MKEHVTSLEVILIVLKQVRQDPAYRASKGSINRVNLLMDKVERSFSNPLTSDNIDQISGDLCEVIDLLRKEKERSKNF